MMNEISDRGNFIRPKKIKTVTKLSAQTKLTSDFDFKTTNLISEILCDKCHYGYICTANPPCKAYHSLSEFI
jgi:hypothetical protein